MSSTNRGAERSPADFYATPEWCTRALLRWLGTAPDLTGQRRAVRAPSIVVDPCAGTGAILRVVQAAGHRVGAVELREECRADLNALVPGGGLYGDALAKSGMLAELRNVLRPVPGAAVVTNPPYSLAQEFIETWAPCVEWSAWLLRLNFIGSQKRAVWFRGEGRPSHVLVLPRRPSFTGKGTDSCEYAWFVWPGRGARALTTVLEVLDASE